MGLLWNQLGSLSYEVLYVVKPDGTGEGSETAQDHSLQQKKTLKKRPEAHEPSVYLVYKSHEICSYEWADVPVVGLRCFFYIPRLSLSHRVRQYSWSLALNPVQVKPLASHR